MNLYRQAVLVAFASLVLGVAFVALAPWPTITVYHFDGAVTHHIVWKYALQLAACVLFLGFSSGVFYAHSRMLMYASLGVQSHTAIKESSECGE